MKISAKHFGLAVGP